jgi:hypothetical protein
MPSFLSPSFRIYIFFFCFFTKMARTYKTKTRRRTTGRRKQRGKGLLDKVLDSGKILGYEIPEMHLRGLSGKYNFAGPFTKLKKRLDDSGRPVRGSEPINEIDRIAMQHDIDYELGMSKKEADKKMIEALDRMKPRNWREKVDRLLVRSAIRGKQMFGLGKTKTKQKGTSSKTKKRPKQRGGALSKGDRLPGRAVNTFPIMVPKPWPPVSATKYS